MEEGQFFLITIAESVPKRLRDEMSNFSGHVITNFVRTWYSTLLPDDQEFPAHCRSSLNYILNKVYTTTVRKDPVHHLDAVVGTCFALIGGVLEDLRQAYKLKDQVSDPIGLRQYALKNPNTLLSRIMGREQSRSDFAKRSMDLLNAFACQGDLQCKPLACLLQHLLTTSVFEAALNKLTDRDLINTIICSALTAPSGTGLAAAPSKSPLAHSFVVPDVSENLCQKTINPRSSMIEQSEVLLYNMAENLEEDAELGTTAKRTRGRRHSFRAKSTSSLAEFVSDEEPQFQDKRRSFLQRTGSLLARSSSRSSSPTKDCPSSSGRHSRSRSVSPFKKKNLVVNDKGTNDTLSSAQSLSGTHSLYLAELIVSDCSDIGHSGSYQTIRKDNVPKFSILVSPVKQHESLSSSQSAGFGIFRTIFDVQHLADRLQDAPMEESLARFRLDLAFWPQLTHAGLEQRVTAYLTALTKSKALAESNAFVFFCRNSTESFDKKQLDRPDKLAQPSTNVGAMKNENSKRESSTHDLIDVHDRLSHQPRISRSCMEVESVSQTDFAGSTSQEPKLPIQKDLAPSNDPLGEPANWSNHDIYRVDVPCMISQSIELLVHIYALSPKSWVIRRQLLSLLRGLILSRSNMYTQSFLEWLDSTVFRPLSDPELVATMLSRFNQHMFSTDYDVGKPLLKHESDALATSTRNLFIQSAMPVTIKNLMGAVPTAESLSIIFDALQNQEFSYGFFSLILNEVLKVITLD